MKVRYTEFALNPALRGTTTHLPSYRAQALIDSGAAVEVLMPARGTAGWHAAMTELEAERVKNIPADQRHDIPTVPQWSVRFLEQSRKFVVVVNSLMGETIYGESVQLDGRGRPDLKGAEKQLVFVLKEARCPQAVIQKYLDSKHAPDFLAQEAARIEADKQAAAAQREREKNTIHFI
jgi:hypothetical protein